MRRAFTLALCSLLIAGCATRGAKPAPKGGDSAVAPSAATEHTVPGPVQVVGRVISLDLRSLTVVIELSPFAVLPPDFNGRILISRQDDLRPTARLQASAYLRGRILGARLLAGKSQIGDEVVFAPATP
jgi:hypothetical protein